MNQARTDRANLAISRVICVCEKKDLDTWRLACRMIPSKIEADDYLLLCPDDQVVDFQRITCDSWKIEGESAYAQNCGIGMIRLHTTGANCGRENWLFQQFLKINAILMSGLPDDDVILIWDADTVPLRKLDFVADGRLETYPAAESHKPYFITMERLLGFGKQTACSFIAQCLPVKVGWVRHLVTEIEKRHHMDYPEAVLSVLRGESGSEFSEYEMIGNWVMRHYPDELIFKSRGRWLRSGRLFTGTCAYSLRARLALGFLSLMYDYAAIEVWGGAGSKLRSHLARLFVGFR